MQRPYHFSFLLLFQVAAMTGVWVMGIMDGNMCLGSRKV